jgi:hypothetical protein
LANKYIPLIGMYVHANLPYTEKTLGSNNEHMHIIIYIVCNIQK